MRPTSKWLVRSLVSVVSIALLVVGLLVFSLGTETGTRFAINRISTFLPGEIELDQFDGTLWSGMRIPILVYRDAKREIRASEVVLDVNWPSVTLGRLGMNVVNAASLEYRSLQPADGQPKPFEWSMEPLPLHIGIAASRIDRITLIRAPEPIVFVGATFVDIELEGVSLLADEVSAATRNVSFSTTSLAVEVEGDVAISAQYNWSLTDNNWAGYGAFRGSLASLTFDQEITGPFPASVSGDLEILHRVVPVIDAHVEWAQWSINDYLLTDGQADVGGTIDQYDADFDFSLQVPAGLNVRVVATVSGDTEQFTTFDAAVSNPSGNADLSGSFVWRPELVAEADVRATDIDPSVFAENLVGNLVAEGHVEVDGSGALTFSNAVVTGILNDAPIDARGDVAMAPQQINCRDCLIAVGDNRISIDGNSTEAGLALALSVNAPSLEMISSQLAGSLEGQGRFTGSRTLPKFTGELHAQQIQIADWAAGDIVVRSEASSQDEVNLSATVTDLFNAGRDFGRFNLTSQGTTDSLDLEVDWSVRGVEVAAAGELRQRDENIDGVITRATIDEPDSGLWSLNEAFRFEVAGNNVDITGHTWSNDSSRLQVSKFSRGNDEMKLIASIADFPLAMANAFIPAGYQLQGSADAEIDVVQESGNWLGSIDWRQANTVLRVLEPADQAVDVSIPFAELHAQLKDGGAVVAAALSIDPGVTGELDLTLERLTDDSPIVASVRLEGSDWEWVPVLIPDIDKLEGKISAVVDATGSLVTPEFKGDLNWQEGSLELPALNVPVSDIELTLSGASDGAATIAGSAKAGEGDLAFDGTIEELLQPSRLVRINVKGENAESVNWPEYQIWSSPDLVVTGSSEGWTINGDLAVPRAEIALREIPEATVKLSPDVSVIGREEEVAEPTRLSGETRLILGEQVHIDAFGLNAELEGELLVKLSNDRPISADGEVSLVGGEFSMYGQTLTIEEGTLIFTGPLDNPLVDVRAVRNIEAFEGPITAGVHLQGRAQAITSTVFSNPAMEEADALSYLVVGRPLAQATESEGNSLSNAAVALGVRQAARITQEIGQIVGLDQLELAGDGGDTTALVAGKQVNDRLHARYAYGVFTRLGTLLLRYKMSRRLVLEAGAGEIQSINVLYTVEKQ